MEQINQIVSLIKERGLYPDIKTVCSAPEPEVIINGRKYLLFCSSNYLGLSTNKNVVNAAIKAVKKYGVSPHGSRLMCGNIDIHEKLEGKLAKFKGTEAAIVFAAGIVVNTGTIPALFDAVDKWRQALNIGIKFDKGLIISDELNHACIIDGCRISRADKAIYRHKNLNELDDILKKNKNRRKLIVTDSLFSLDGDLAPLPEIVNLAERYNSLVMIDDAHGTGVFGENGRGVAEHFGVDGKIDVKMGTLTKAVGCGGGFVAGSKDLIDFLRISARTYLFTCGLHPVLGASAYTAISEMEKHPELRAKLWENTDYMLAGFKSLGFDTMESKSPIIPILIGDEKKAIKLAGLLFENGIFALCVRYPAVSQGKARIRFVVMSTHTKKQIDYLLDIIKNVGRKLEII